MRYTDWFEIVDPAFKSLILPNVHVDLLYTADAGWKGRSMFRQPVICSFPISRTTGSCATTTWLEPSRPSKPVQFCQWPHARP